MEPLAALVHELPRSVVVTAVRDTLAEARAALRRRGAGGAPEPLALAHAAAARARESAAPVLRRVLNATGKIGRAHV